MTEHLDKGRWASFNAEERAIVFHLATIEEWEETAPEIDQATEAAIFRLLSELERGARFSQRIDALEQEYRAADDLVRELRADPASWTTAGANPRYVSAAVVERLLEVAQSEAPRRALRLIALAGEVVENLSPLLSPQSSLHRQLAVEVRCARAEHLIDAEDYGVAARELRRVAASLTADLGRGRALFCRVLARLRREQKRWDEAISLADRSVTMLNDHGSAREAAQAQIEMGWVLIEAGDADEAMPQLSAALPLVEATPAWAALGRLGLAMAETANNNRQRAQQLLTEADQNTAAVSAPVLRLRLRWISGQVARSSGSPCSAFRRFCRATVGFVTLGEGHAGAVALLDLIAFCHQHQWSPRVLDLVNLQEALLTLRTSPALGRRTRQVLEFAVYAFERQRQCTGEVLLNAKDYLIVSRYQPLLPFRPTTDRGLFHLEWDQLEPEMRRGICAESEMETRLAEIPASGLAEYLQEQIAWRYEFKRRVRILFGAATRPT